ncbi:hypothetical protein GCM10008967_10440 [Bacillus carboniphilus]|uniref:HTH arsR-type domain-containing protein n=1 Tax=Bacillus carboniphilus TaxID=86663 RepID=A0ABN0W0J1_9BACI
MNYTVSASFSPIDELLLSYLLYKNPKNSKYLEVGKDWRKQVEARLSTHFKNEIETLGDEWLFHYLHVLIDKQTYEKQTIEDILSEVSQLSAGDILERIVPVLKQDKALPQDILGERDRMISILKEWDKEYFSTLPSSTIPLLQKANEKTKEQLTKATPTKVIEELTNGMIFESSFIKHIHVMPSLHFRPLTTYTLYHDCISLYYPATTFDSKEARIVLIGKALSDPKRLRILQQLKGEKRSFTELVHLIGDTKGNIHHHISILNTAGLINRHVDEHCQNTLYSPRVPLLKELDKHVHALFS